LAVVGLSACGDDDDPGGTPDAGDGGRADTRVDTRPDTSTRPDVGPDMVNHRDVATTDAALEGGRAPDSGAEGGADGGSPVQRGKYLVENVGACGDCHTPINVVTGQPDNTKFLAGMPGMFQIPGLAPDGGVGIIGSRNLTSDMTTGLGSWTDVQIRRALLDGVDKDNKALFPIMPYYVLHNMTEDDANAIIAYLRTVPAVVNAIPPKNFDLPGPAPFVPANRIPNPALAPTDADYASAMRGKYLAGNFGACMECHTEHVQTPGAVPLNLDKLFAGGESFLAAALGIPSPPFPGVIYSLNITPHASGVQGWTAAAVANTVKNGVDKDGVRLCPPMPSGPMTAFNGITDNDARDIGNYLTHLPPIANTVPLVCHDFVSRDGGPPPDARDGSPSDSSGPEAGPEAGGPDATRDAPADTRPDVTPDTIGDTADTGASDGSDGASGDADANDATGDGARGDGAGNDATGDGATNDAANDGG
jgi:hypothetical protein